MTLFYCRKQARAAIELTGEEVGSFLNDILTAELNSLPVGEMQMSCLLSPQGRILHDMLIFRIRENCFWLEVGNNQILELKKSFEMYRLRKFITIKILENWSSFHFFHIDGKAFSSEQIKEIQAKLDDNELDIWRSGVVLDGKKTNYCEIDIIEEDLKFSFLKITLNEGKNRQIRRIASLLGYKVLDLQRVNFANISLGNLKEGDWKLIDINNSHKI